MLDIPLRSNWDYRTGPLPQTDVERKLGKMEKEIHRDQTERDIQVPFHMMNEYYDDSYEDMVDEETESHLLDREVNRARMSARGITPPKPPYPNKIR
ncbi:MAG: hypothetical protein WD071_10845 [Pseudohongiella sp.]|uniref:hypothetical protein n=1 Tax=Pseudohongiella sp. TaxID=1979412 RepID=UPI00349FE834